MRRTVKAIRGIYPFMPKRYRSTSASQKPQSQSPYRSDSHIIFDSTIINNGDFPGPPLHSNTIGQGSQNSKERNINRVINQIDTASPRPVVDYVDGAGGPSRDRMSFFTSPDDFVSGEVTTTDDIPGIEAGRVVEVRRSGMSTIGLVLAPILIAGRERLLFLRPSGEIWPVAPTDVQFVMPASLIPKDVAKACWSPELLALWANGEDVGIASGRMNDASIVGDSAAQNMITARRRAAGILRKVVREVERMEARLTGGTIVMPGHSGGIEAVWDAFASTDPTQRTSITSAEVAEYLVNDESTDDGHSNVKVKHVTVRPHTLPAFAAHSLLMRRADLFVADERDMWNSGCFMLRSRDERARFQSVAKAIQQNNDTIVNLVAKGKQVREQLINLNSMAPSARSSALMSLPLPEWTNSEQDILSLLALTLYETRSTQIQPADVLAASIVKSFGLGPSESVDASVIARLLGSLGILPPWDSTTVSGLREAADRSMTISKTRLSNDDLLLGSELDALRTDYSSQKVFVIDDATAKELDDGVSLERVGQDDYWIHVHVADPTRYVHVNHPTATRASFIGTSHYLPEGTIPLLPMDLGDVSLSSASSEAKAGQSVMTFSTRVDGSGTISDYRIVMGWVRGLRVTTYDAVDRALGIKVTEPSRPFGRLASDSSDTKSASATRMILSEITDPSDVSELSTLRDLAVKLRSRRFATSGLEWTLPSSKISLLHHPPPIENIFNSSIPRVPQIYPPIDDIKYDYAVTPEMPATTAKTMVAEFMILANRAAAKFCFDRTIPVPFRGTSPIHDTSNTPPGLGIEYLRAKREQGTGIVSPFDVFAANVFMPGSVLSTSPLPHWIMGFDQPDHGYVRATSPLRRYDDMLVHWQIKAALARDAQIHSAQIVPLGEEDVRMLMTRSDNAQIRAKFSQKRCEAFWRAGLFAQRMTGHLPSNYVVHAEEAVDLAGPITARVIGATTIQKGISRIPVIIPSLGAPAALEVMTGLPGLSPGDAIQVRMTTVSQWPNPSVTVTNA